jgi:tryptophanyl-tRNA synthetase
MGARGQGADKVGDGAPAEALDAAPNQLAKDGGGRLGIAERGVDRLDLDLEQLHQPGQPGRLAARQVEHQAAEHGRVDDRVLEGSRESPTEDPGVEGVMAVLDQDRSPGEVEEGPPGVAELGCVDQHLALDEMPPLRVGVDRRPGMDQRVEQAQGPAQAEPLGADLEDQEGPVAGGLDVDRHELGLVQRGFRADGREVLLSGWRLPGDQFGSATRLEAQGPLFGFSHGLHRRSVRASTKIKRPMPQRKRILSGMRPTGRFHLGNYFGAAKNWVALQDEYDCYYMVADYHGLTSQPHAKEFERNLIDLAGDMIAVGVRPESIYLQSSVPEVAELFLLFTMITPYGWVARVPTFKEMARQQPDNVNMGLFSYPVLQAADILLVKGDAVPVGQDQDAHIELARETARRFNKLYGDLFPEPATLRTETPKILGTDGKAKMSKSLGNIIGVTAEPDVIRKQVLSMVTDTRRVYKSQPGHPKSCNVDALFKVFFPEDWQHYWDLCRKAEIGCHDKKKLLAERIIETFAPFREARAALSDEDVKRYLGIGSKRAREAARETVAQARATIGLLPSL